MSFLASLISFDAGQVTDLAQTVATLALGGNLDLLNSPHANLRADTRSRTITLQLLDTAAGKPRLTRQQASKSDLATVAAVLPSTSVPQTPPKSGALATVTFDVTRTASGWAQRFSYTAVSRQGEQQTALGFHVNEWAVGIGSLVVDSIVSLAGNPPGAVDEFFRLLYLAKRTRPLSDEYPKLLRYADSYLGRTFVITQRGVTLTESADEPNIARLRIEAGVLRDYTDAWGYVNTAPPNALSGAPSAAGSDIAALQAFG